MRVWNLLLSALSVSWKLVCWTEPWGLISTTLHLAYPNERKGQAGAELRALHRSMCLYTALGIRRIQRWSSQFAWNDLAWPNCLVQLWWIEPSIFVRLKSHRSRRKKDGSSFFWFWNFKGLKPMVQQLEWCWGRVQERGTWDGGSKGHTLC